MRPGRLPEDHPLEQIARERLRALSPEAQDKQLAQATQTAGQLRPQPQPLRPQQPIRHRW